MSVVALRATKPRVLAGAAILVVAAAIMYVLGANMVRFGLGVVVGFAAVGAVAFLAARRGKGGGRLEDASP